MDYKHQTMLDLGKGIDVAEICFDNDFSPEDDVPFSSSSIAVYAFTVLVCMYVHWPLSDDQQCWVKLGCQEDSVR